MSVNHQGTTNESALLAAHLLSYASLGDVLRHHAEHRGDALAFTFTSGGKENPARYTYRDLYQASAAIAEKLVSIDGNVAGERALLLFNPGFDYIASFFGCLLSGVIAVPAYPPMSNRDWPRLLSIADDCTARTVLTSSALLQTVRNWLGEREASVECVAVDQLHAATEAASTNQHFGVDVDTHCTAFLQYTSGSTGSPKGVMVTHGNLLHNCGAIMKAMQATKETVGVSWLPPYHDMGLIGGILSPILGGFPVHLMSPLTFLKKPLIWLETISRERGTISGGPNFAYEYCAKRIDPKDVERLDLSCWRVAANGAEPINHASLQLFSEHFAAAGFTAKTFLPCYGLAEATLMVSGVAVDSAPRIVEADTFALARNVFRAPIDDGNRTRLVSNGNVVCDTRVFIVNPATRREAGAGEIGEVWVQGPGVAVGYWQRSDATEATFDAYFSNTQHEVVGPCMRTGDLGFLHESEVIITGRAKEIIIIRGRNYYPQDIEWIVQEQHPALQRGNGAAFGVSQDDGEVLVMVQEIARSAARQLDDEPTFQKLVHTVNQALSEQTGLQLHALVLIESGSLLKTSSGKIQRVSMRQAYLDGSLSVIRSWQRQQVVRPALDTSATTTPTADFLNTDFALTQMLAQWVSEALGVSAAEIDIDLPFSALGLDSVQGVEIAARLEKHLGRDLPPTLLFRYPTINDLTAFINNGGATSSSQEKTEFDDLDSLSHEELIDRLKSELLE